MGGALKGMELLNGILIYFLEWCLVLMPMERKTGPGGSYVGLSGVWRVMRQFGRPFLFWPKYVGIGGVELMY